MDRFEDWKKKDYFKHCPHLHSSMDRFEDMTGWTSQQLYSIYIPVWIDLKLDVYFTITFYNTIYIPVWIDLKTEL